MFMEACREKFARESPAARARTIPSGQHDRSLAPQVAPVLHPLASPSPRSRQVPLARQPQKWYIRA